MSAKKQKLVTVEAQGIDETVLVIWDPLYEKVVSVHRSEEGVHKKLKKLSTEPHRFEYEDFPLED